MSHDPEVDPQLLIGATEKAAKGKAEEMPQPRTLKQRLLFQQLAKERKRYSPQIPRIKEDRKKLGILAAIIRIIRSEPSSVGTVKQGISWMEKTHLLRKHRKHRKSRNRIATESRRANRRTG